MAAVGASDQAQHSLIQAYICTPRRKTQRTVCRSKQINEPSERLQRVGDSGIILLDQDDRHMGLRRDVEWRMHASDMLRERIP
jgi:hypothetical protein